MLNDLQRPCFRFSYRLLKHGIRAAPIRPEEARHCHLDSSLKRFPETGVEPTKTDIPGLHKAYED